MPFFFKSVRWVEKEWLRDTGQPYPFLFEACGERNLSTSIKRTEIVVAGSKATP